MREQVAKFVEPARSTLASGGTVTIETSDGDRVDVREIDADGEQVVGVTGGSERVAYHIRDVPRIHMVLPAPKT